MRYRLLLPSTLLLLALPTLTSAQIVNGDFEASGVGWIVDPPPPGWTVTFPPAGGNPGGYARIQSRDFQSEGFVCIRQRFFCGVPSANTQCQIRVDVRLEQIDAADLTGRVHILIDGVDYLPPLDPAGYDWRQIAFSVPCGEHEIALCLEVDAGNNLWGASFDNAAAECLGGVPAMPSTWGRVKQVYR
jgi:hypothetical protein